MPDLVQEGAAGRAIDVDRQQPDEADEPRKGGAGNPEMGLERGRVGMRVDHAHLGPVLGEIDVIAADLRLIRLDELGQLGDGPLELVQLAGYDIGSVDVDDRSGHLISRSAACR
jgi:hypothetical protein